jgi:hypothetical protein
MAGSLAANPRARSPRPAGDALLSPVITRRLIESYTRRPPATARPAPPRRADTARARSPTAPRARPLQRRHRHAADRRRCHRQNPRRPHLHQAQPPRPRPSRRPRLRKRTRPTGRNPHPSLTEQDRVRRGQGLVPVTRFAFKVYSLPASLLWTSTTSAPAPRWASAIRSACRTRSARMCAANCQPTIARLQASITNAEGRCLPSSATTSSRRTKARPGETL